MTDKNRPSKHYKLMGIEAAQWNRVYDSGKEPIKNYTFQKSYKDKNGEWQKTTSFGVSDLPILASLILNIIGENVKSRWNEVDSNANEAKETLIEGNTVPQQDDVPF